MLKTKLAHIESKNEFKTIIESNENVMVCCGRMGPMCVPVYWAMEQLQSKYPTVKFYDMDFDIPDATVVKSLPECRNFMGLPFTVYYKNGKLVEATTSIQTEEQITNIIKKNFM